jgi:hypothetical protein
MHRLAIATAGIILVACSSSPPSSTTSSSGAAGGSTGGMTGTGPTGGSASGGATGSASGGSSTGGSCGGATCKPNEVCVNDACCFAPQACGNICCPGNISDPESMVQFCAGGGCCPEAQSCGLSGPDPFCCATGQSCNEGSNFCCPTAQVCGFLCCGPTEKCNTFAGSNVSFCVRGSSSSCTPTLSGTPSPVDTGVLCDGGGHAPTTGTAFPYLDATDPTYELQACNSTAECGCLGAGKGMTCVRDYNFATLGYPSVGAQGVCERQCLANADCPRADTICEGGFCTLNLCGKEIPYNGVTPGACDARGCRDGTCVPFPLSLGAGSAYCVAAAFVDGGCEPAAKIGVTQSIPCAPGDVCTPQGCQQLCNPTDAGTSNGCPAGTGCFATPGEVADGGADAGLDFAIGTCETCANPSGACCLAAQSPCAFDTDCCSNACDASTNSCSP